MRGGARRTSRRTARRTSRRVNRRQAAFQSMAQPPPPPAPAPPPPAPAPPPPAPAPASTTTDDRIRQLKELGELRDAGVLTDAEFEAQKARILAS